MQYVAADRDLEPLDPALGATDGQRVEQALCRMLVGAVTGVDHGTIDFSGQELHPAGRRMADHDGIGCHRIQRHGRVDQRFALLHRRLGNRHRNHVGAEALGGDLEAGHGPRRILEEQVDHRHVLQVRFGPFARTGRLGKLFSEIQDMVYVETGKVFNAQQVSVIEFVAVARNGHALPFDFRRFIRDSGMGQEARTILRAGSRTR